MKRIFTLLLIYACTAVHAQQQGLDPTFGNGGIVIKGDPLLGSNWGVGGICLLPDGKLMVAGDSLASHNIDGTIDYSFGNNGAVRYYYGTIVLLQPDGKIITAGGRHLYPGRAGAYRLLSDGTADSSFGANGKITVDDSTDVVDALLQPDGRLILLGENSQKKYFALFRYLANGRPDSSFGGNGRVFRYHEPYPTRGMYLKGGGLMADGRIVIGGETLSIINTPDSFFAMRFLPDGAIDSSLNHRGMAAVPGLWPCGAVALQDDGKILLAGHTLFGGPVRFTMTRINVDGSIDSDFADGGIAVYQWPTGKENKVRVMKVQPDGKIILAGRVGTGGPDSIREPGYSFALLRYLPSGQLDSSFGADGALLTKIGNDWDEILDITLQPDGKIIAVGTIQPNNAINGAIVRYLPDGKTATGNPLPSAGEITLYPNPAHDRLYIHYPDSLQIKSLMLYDATGRLLRQWNSKITEININDKAKGVYLLRLVSATGHTTGKPFVIQ